MPERWIARAASLGVWLGLAACFCGCKDERPTSSSATPQAPSGSVPAPSGSVPGSMAAPKPNEPDETTSPNLALANFNAQFAEYERHLQAEPQSLRWIGVALGAYQDRVAYLGDMNALDRLVELGKRAVHAHPKEAKAYLLRASARSAIHDFKGARADLDEAEKLGAEEVELKRKRASLAMALGDYDAACPVLAAEAVRFGHLGSLGMEAICLGHMLRYQEADLKFDAAQKSHRGVSPFPIGWLYFNRAEMWDRAGEPDKARGFYRITVERMPAYARAAVHLSELSAAPDARSMLAKAAETSNDPEVPAALFLVHEELKLGSGKDYFDQAKARYDELMAKYPLAFSDHAATFYLNFVKDPRKASEAAKLDFDNRKTSESYELWIAAQLAAKKTADACATADLGLKLKYATSDLKATAAEAYEQCGQKDLAEKLNKEIGPQLAVGRGR